MRIGIGPDNPIGSEWTRIGGDLKQISVDSVNNAVWGVSTTNQIFKGKISWARQGNL